MVHYVMLQVTVFTIHHLMILKNSLQPPTSIGQNLRAYINGFSENMREVIDKFKLWGTIDTLEEKGLLFLLIQKFANVDLHPDAVSNHEMGYIFEELIRKFNEQTNENPGEHFTPREVIRLMVNLLLARTRQSLPRTTLSERFMILPAAPVEC